MRRRMTAVLHASSRACYVELCTFPLAHSNFSLLWLALPINTDFNLMKSNSNHLESQFWIRHVLTWNVKVQKYPVNIPKCHFLSTTERNQWSLVIYDNRNLSYETAMHVPQPLKETFSYVVQIQTFYNQVLKSINQILSLVQIN